MEPDLFPDELLFLCLSYLPLQTKLKCGRVCQKWKHHVQHKQTTLKIYTKTRRIQNHLSLQTSIFLQSHPPSSSLTPLILSFPNLSSLTLDTDYGFSSATLISLVRNCQKVSLEIADETVVDELLRDLPDGIRRLKIQVKATSPFYAIGFTQTKMYCDLSSLEFFLQRQKSIKTLILRGFRVRDYESRPEFSNSLTESKLQKIKLAYADQFPYEIFTQNQFYASESYPETFKKMASRVSQLSIIRHYEFYSDEPTWDFLLNPELKNLKILKLLQAYNEIPTDFDLARVFENNPKITNLALNTISCCQFISVAPLLQNITKLYFKFHDRVDIPDEAWEVIGKYMLNLRILRNETEDFPFKALGRSLSPLNVIESIESSSLNRKEITIRANDVIQDLVLKCPNLQNFQCWFMIWTKQAFLSLSQSKCRLTYLQIPIFEDGWDEGFIHWIKEGGAEELRCLRIGWDKHDRMNQHLKKRKAQVAILSDEFIADLVMYCRKLRSLTIYLVDGVSYDGWKQLLELKLHAFKVGSDTIPKKCEFLDEVCLPFKDVGLLDGPLAIEKAREKKRIQREKEELEEKRRLEREQEMMNAQTEGKKYFEEIKEQIQNEKTKDMMKKEAIRLANVQTDSIPDSALRGSFLNGVLCGLDKLQDILQEEAYWKNKNTKSSSTEDVAFLLFD